MKHLLILLALVLLSPTLIIGQSISSYVITSAGEAIMSDDGALYLSIGEPMNTELDDGDIMISQGFLQVSMAGRLLSTEEEILKEEITVYPNPTAQEIHFSLKDAHSNYACRIYDINGHLLTEINTLNHSAINVSEFPSGSYFVTLHKDSRVSETIQFTKL